MKSIYLAGNTAVVERERKVLSLKQDRLDSYFFITPGQIQYEAWEDTLKNDLPIKIFLDSGAFSAFSQGVTIDIQEYIKFIADSQLFNLKIAHLPKLKIFKPEFVLVERA